jgi:2-amino-4-hydroxy-6-hydroxymethyldihydropteridine diphosphokinase
MATCLLGLGSNLGDRVGILSRAAEQLRQHPQVEHVLVSRWHAYPPIGGPQGQGEFLNGAARLETSLSPEELRRLLHELERRAGRERVIRWAERPLDIDLLLYDDRQIHTAELQVPHPRMATRRFVLEPAAEVAGPMIDPQTGWSISRLWQHLQSAPPYFALAGIYLPALAASGPSVAQRVRAVYLADSSGTGLTGSAEPDRLEFYRERCRKLQRTLRRGLDQAAGGQPLLSGFWVGQCEIEGAWLAAERRADVRSEREAGMQPIRLEIAHWAVPKLVIVLRTTADMLGDEFVAPWIRKLPTSARFALQDAISRVHRGSAESPALVLDVAADFSPIDDIVAAVEAMR